jgi:hypothetical protein
MIINNFLISTRKCHEVNRDYPVQADDVFLLNIEHPAFTAGVNQDWIYDPNGKPQYWPVDDYFYPGKRVTQFLGQNVTKQHHTLTHERRIPSGSC